MAETYFIGMLGYVLWISYRIGQQLPNRSKVDHGAYSINTRYWTTNFTALVWLGGVAGALVWPISSFVWVGLLTGQGSVKQ